MESSGVNIIRKEGSMKGGRTRILYFYKPTPTTPLDPTSPLPSEKSKRGASGSAGWGWERIRSGKPHTRKLPIIGE